MNTRWLLTATMMVAMTSFLALAQSTHAAAAADSNAADSDSKASEHKATVTISPEAFVVPKMEGVTTKIVDTPQGKALSISSTGIDKPFVIELGWMAVSPETDYLCRYQVQRVSLKENANFYMMIREHAKENARPFSPYHKTSVRLRELLAVDSDKWVTRQQAVNTTKDTHVLSGAIVIAELKGEILISAFEVIDNAAAAKQAKAAAQAEYKQLMTEVRAQADARKMLAPRTLVYSRSQMKYGLERNYDHTWIDRPLFVNREYRVSRKFVTPLPSYTRILQEVAQYDIDGLAFFPETTGRMGMFELHGETGVEGVGLLPEFLPGYPGREFSDKVEILQRAMKSPYVPRINGKLVITSYAAEAQKPEQWKAMLDNLRKEVGDTFIFLPTVTNVVGLMRPFNEGEPISRAEIQNAKAHLRTWLDATDGIYFNYPAAFRKKDHSFNGEFYSEIFIPVFKSVLSEPAYKNKYLGLSAYKSHMNADRSNSLQEDGTRTLRASFEAAMQGKPDILILPEWDEFNENTCFRPTTYGSTTTQRIVRYYMSQIKNTQPTPLADDDLSIPNLVLSARKFVTLGEDIAFELLNVPDTTEADEYAVQLTLRDAHGQIVHEFAPVTFDAANLQEHRLHIQSQDIASVRALVPSLKITGYKDNDFALTHGFHHVQLRATWNWDMLYVKQPVRELPSIRRATLAWADSKTWTAKSDEPLLLKGSVDSNENIALIEVLADDDVVSSIDARDEFFRNDPTRELLLIEYRSINTQEIKGSVVLKNSQGDWIANGTVLHQAETALQIDHDKVTLNSPASIHERWIYLAMPKSDLDKAVLSFEFENAKFEVPVRDVFEKKMISRPFANGLHFAISPYRKQIDMPYHLNEKGAGFNIQVWPEIGTEQYHLRVTTVSGKTYRTAPLLVPGGVQESSQNLRVFSDDTQSSVDLKVAADRIPQVVYDFDPSRGAVLLTKAGRPFWATLGGFTNTVTGRGAHTGLFRGYPNEVTSSAPAWSVDDQNKPTLVFDGVGTYLTLPREVFPWHGSWTFKMEIKPDDDRNQTLLINRILHSRQMGLKLSVMDGKLIAAFRPADARFETALKVPAGQWSTIEASYDFQQLVLTVNGVSETFPLTEPAYNVGFTVIGNDVRDQNFKGQLRALSVLHDVK